MEMVGIGLSSLLEMRARSWSGSSRLGGVLLALFLGDLRPPLAFGAAAGLGLVAAVAGLGLAAAVSGAGAAMAGAGAAVSSLMGGMQLFLAAGLLILAGLGDVRRLAGGLELSLSRAFSDLRTTAPVFDLVAAILEVMWWMMGGYVL